MVKAGDESKRLPAPRFEPKGVPKKDAAINRYSIVTTLVDLLFAELLLHLSFEKQVLCQTITFQMNCNWIYKLQKKILDLNWDSILKNPRKQQLKSEWMCAFAAAQILFSLQTFLPPLLTIWHLHRAFILRQCQGSTENGADQPL